MAITIVGQPDQIMPAYNPVVYYINSNNKNITGFRYVIQIFNAGTNTLHAEFKVVPRPGDGYGYVDISKVVQSRVSSYLNINGTGSSPADNGTVYSYDIKFGEEFIPEKVWQAYSSYSDPVFGNLTRITSLSHGYVANDQITLTTDQAFNDARITLNGNFTVLQVLSPSQYVINLPYPGFFSGPTTGKSKYSDNRITRDLNLASILNRRVFNRAYPFDRFPSYSQNQIILGAPNREILNNAPRTGFYVRPNQKLYWNFWDNKQALARRIFLVNDAGEQFYVNAPSLSDFVKQVNVGFGANLVPVAPATLPLIKPTTKYYDVFSTSSALIPIPGGTQTSEKRRIYIDRECPINATQILFLDRAGSWSSFAFQLREYESGTVTRESYRKELGNLVSGKYQYNTTETGTTNWFISNEKQFQLNTNWMTDEMSVYFEELITSPQMFIRFGELTKFGSEWLSCVVTDTNYNVERSKNKKLIKKTITIKLANNDNINI
jgi:hypothetical protein